MCIYMSPEGEAPLFVCICLRPFPACDAIFRYIPTGCSTWLSRNVPLRNGGFPSRTCTPVSLWPGCEVSTGWAVDYSSSSITTVVFTTRLFYTFGLCVAGRWKCCEDTATFQIRSLLVREDLPFRFARGAGRGSVGFDSVTSCGRRLPEG